MKQLFGVFINQITREFLINFRSPAACMHSLLFFTIVIILFPLAIAPDPRLLQSIAPGVIWVAALLASMLSLENIFQLDYEEGILEQWLINPVPLCVLVIAKIIAHWLLSAVPLLLLTPILGFMMQLKWDEIVILVLSLIIGTPILSCIGAIGAAITLSLGSRGILLSLLILPLCIPILILGAGSTIVYMGGISVLSILLLLLALLILALVFSPFATAAALRLNG